MKPDVALLDVRMPGKDGVEVVHALRKQANADRRCILLTTFDDDAVLLDGRARRRARLSAQGRLARGARRRAANGGRAATR